MKKKMQIIGCAMAVGLVIVVPVFLDYCIIGNGINSNVGKDSWMSFFGSYFGGLFGAFATVTVFCFTFLDSEKKRIEGEEKRKMEQDTQWRLSIMPCLQVREKVYKEKEKLRSEGNVYYICVGKGNVLLKREISKITELGYDAGVVIESEIRNVGMGSAVLLNTYVNEKQVLFNESLMVNQDLRLYYIFDEKDAYHQEVKVRFEYVDTGGLGQYRQSEELILMRINDGLNWEHKKTLTMPELVNI